MTNIDKTDKRYSRYFETLDMLEHNLEDTLLKQSLSSLVKALHSFYGVRPILLIDEYDAPIINAHQEGFREKFTSYYANLLTSALKGNVNISQALLTGIQRVAKESIFSKLNNMVVYNVLNEQYAKYFGLTDAETRDLLGYYDLELNDDVKSYYDGYLFAGVEVYHPWSILSYAQKQKLQSYWIKTSTNVLIRESILIADHRFHRSFKKLITEGTVMVNLNLAASFTELPRTDTLWGLFVNAGYVTVIDADYKLHRFTVCIPNEEIKTEFKEMVSDYAKLSNEV